MSSENRFSTIQNSINEVLCRQKEQELIKRLPTQLSNQFISVAQIYSEVTPNKDWQVPELTDPDLVADLHLIKALEPLNLEKSQTLEKSEKRLPFQRRLAALTILDYCYNPKEMSKRTGITTEEIESVSYSSRQAVALAGSELLQKAYNAEPLDNEKIDPNSFSRPNIVFITPKDMRILGHNQGYGGMAYEKAKLVVVSVVEKLPFYYENNEDQNRANRLFISIHELSHLLRLYQKEKLHYGYSRNYESDMGQRICSNLEEGGATLLTILAGEKLNLDYTNGGPSEYIQAAKRISTGLIPKLVKIAQERWPYVRNDFSTKKTTDKDIIKETITAQSMLGDYSLLYRLTQDHKIESTQARFIRTKLKGGFSKESTWIDTSAFLSDTEIFGVEFEFLWEKGFQNMPEDSHKIDNFPILYNHFGGFRYEFNQQDCFEIYDSNSKSWQKINPSLLDLSKHQRVRVNYLDVYSDSVK